jgi:intracellular multiplication protein IcmE
MQKLQGYWTTQPHSSVRLAPEPAQQAAVAQSSQGTRSAQGLQGAAATVTAPDIRTGDLKYAVLDIGINTDDPDAANVVMATIREPGRFNGARLIGQVQVGDQYSKTVGLHFTRMSVPGESQPRQIDAWAVNPSTERPALASDVNNHYLSRGASIFIGSFLEGYSEGLLRGGQNQNVITNGTTVTVQTDAYTNKQLMQIGAGNVGKKMADVFGQGATRPPTIRVNAGADMGVWFIQDSAPGETRTAVSAQDVASVK